MSIPALNEATIRRHATPESLAQGEAYYQTGAVVDVIQRDQVLQALVEGSEARPYRVTLRFDGGGLTSTHCTCPYSFGGWCKHIVATLFICLRQPETIEERPTLEHLLNRLTWQQLQGLVQALVAKQPDLIETIDRHVSLLTTPDAQAQPKPPTRRTMLDPAPFQREVRQILRDAVHAFEYGGEEDTVTEDLREVIQNAQDFTEQGDGSNALVILVAVTEACIAHWKDVDDYGIENHEVVDALNKAVTEAILSTDLTPEETAELGAKVESWEDAWGGADFAMSLEALRQGWDYLPLQRVLQGTITELGAWDRKAPDYADDLALIRLKILDRQERYPEYLYLAEAEGQTKAYLTMLVHVGRIEEAMQAAQTQMSSMEEAFALAQALRQQGAVEQALHIGQTGLTLPGRCCYTLAIWTSDLAEGIGDRQAALSARIMGFKDKPCLNDYQKAEDLAGEQWLKVKEDLLNSLRTRSSWSLDQAKVDIFLREGLMDDAITAVQDLHSYQSDLIGRVMDAAIHHNPVWVIENASRRAESIMDEGKAKYYHHAVDWLKKARAAYLAADRRAEWSAYRNRLMTTHARKYKLMGMLKQRDME